MQRDLLQIKLRDNLVRQRVEIISSVRFTLKSLGIALPSPNSETFNAHEIRVEVNFNFGLSCSAVPPLRRWLKN